MYQHSCCSASKTQVEAGSNRRTKCRNVQRATCHNKRAVRYVLLCLRLQAVCETLSAERYEQRIAESRYNPLTTLALEEAGSSIASDNRLQGVAMR